MKRLLWGVARSAMPERSLLNYAAGLVNRRFAMGFDALASDLEVELASAGLVNPTPD